MVFSPLGLFFVGAAAEQAGHTVDYVDLNVDPLPEGYDAYLVTGTTPQLKSMLEVGDVEGLKIAGGPHATMRPQDLKGFDYVVVGEGERIIPTVLNGEWPKGIVCAERIKGEFPHPLRTWSHRYHYTLNGLPATHAMLSRGCPWKCAFCTAPLWNHKVSFMPFNWCEQELDTIANQGYAGVMFYDDTFTINRRRVAIIGQMLKDRNLIWRCFVRSDTVTRETANTLAHYGCVEVGMGVESGSDEILRTIHKETTYEQNAEAVRILKDAGIRTKVFLVVGLPGETPETVELTKQWLREARPTDWDTALFVPYPGTPIHDYKENYDIHWDAVEADKMWWKGIPGHYEALCSTSALTRQDIVRCRDEIDAIKKEIL
mgnify:CR=1 FL=1